MKTMFADVVINFQVNWTAVFVALLVAFLLFGTNRRMTKRTLTTRKNGKRVAKSKLLKYNPHPNNLNDIQ